jgi:hypothetical protein
MRLGVSATTLGVLVAGGVCACAVFAQPTALGPQFEMAATTDPQTYNGGVAVGDGGEFMVTWDTPTSNFTNSVDTFGRVFAADATPQGPAFVVSTYTYDVQEESAVAAVPGGGFVVVWQSYEQLGESDEIFGQRFDATGAPVGGEFHVNTYTDEAQRNPSVAVDASGRFVVTWDSYYQFGMQDRDDIVARRFDAAGAPLSGEFLVTADPLGQQDEPDVAALPTGEFLVVWQGDDGAEGRPFAGDGSPQGAGVVMDATAGSPAIAAHGGGFVTAYTPFYPTDGVSVRAYDASGVALTGGVTVSENGSAAYPDIAAAAGGRFLVVWDDADAEFGGVLGRFYDPPATPLGDAFVVNTHAAGGQGGAAVASNADGTFVVTWAGDGPSGDGIFARRFRAYADERIGVTATKLIVVDKIMDAGEAKVVYVSKDTTAGIAKGPGTDAAAIDVGFQVTYDSAAGAFTIPAGGHDGTQGWLVNSPTVAKFVNSLAPGGTSGVSVAVIKPDKLLKLVGRSLGDMPIDLVAAGPPVGTIVTEYRVTNGGDTYRFCSAFDPAVPLAVTWKEIAGGTGRKLVARGGTPSPCP